MKKFSYKSMKKNIAMFMSVAMLVTANPAAGMYVSADTSEDGIISAQQKGETEEEGAQQGGTTEEDTGKQSGTTEKETEKQDGTTEKETEKQDGSTEEDTGKQSSTEQSSTEEKTTEATTEAPTTATELAPEQGTVNNGLVYTGLSPADAKVLLIDPGHCKVHTGAAGNGLKEEVVVLDISQAMYDALLDYGDITVYMTRETGACCKNLGLGDCLYARSNYAKKLQADFLVSVHINAGYSSGANALVAYKSGYHDRIRQETQAFGRIALKELHKLGIANRGFLLRKSGTGRYSNGKTADYYAIVRRGVVDQIPAVIMEHGYITSASDCRKYFKTKAQRTKVGNADANAVISYYNLSKKTVAGDFVQEDGATYYKNIEGQKVCGWVKSHGVWFYFDETTGQMKTGFITQGDNTFFLSPNTGEMVVGAFTVDGYKYMARGNGTIVKASVYSDGVGTYLYDLEGRKLNKGFHTIDNNTYYVVNDKKVAHGLTKIGSAKYYFDNNSAVIVTGWKKINGKYYYFDEETGKMAKKKWIGKYYVNKNGVRTKKK